MQVDSTDAASLARFCEGCRVVVNCAAGTPENSRVIALAALRAGADYADVADLSPTELSEVDARFRECGRSALFAAGLVPGLSALLPRVLASRHPGAQVLTAYVGGCDRFSAGGAKDYCRSLKEANGAAMACWRGGRKLANARPAQPCVELPFFSPRITAYPYLSEESERLAHGLRLEEIRWYSVFDGSRVVSCLATAARLPLEEFVCEVRRAADLDLFGRTRYQTLLFELAMTAPGSAVGWLAVRGMGASELSAAFTSLAARALAAAQVATGAHRAGETLEPDATWELLRTSRAVEIAELRAGALPAARMEEAGL
jgi:hypothetical protein